MISQGNSCVHNNNVPSLGNAEAMFNILSHGEAQRIRWMVRSKLTNNCAAIISYTHTQKDTLLFTSAFRKITSKTDT